MWVENSSMAIYREGSDLLDFSLSCFLSHFLYVSLSHLGPVVQSIVSLTSSLRGQLVKCFTTL